MILLRDLHLENFMRISSLDISFEDDTIISISGENGSGKSTIIYAIALCITGYRKGESYRNYVKMGEDTAKVILNAELKGYPINYELEIKGNNKTGNPLKKIVTYKGNTYLNSDYDSFMKEQELEYIENLMFLFQGNNDLINSRPTERASLLKKLFQFEFTDIVKPLKEKQEQNKIQNIETSTLIKELNSRTFNKQILSREIPNTQISKWEDQVSEINEKLNKIGNIDERSIDKYNSELNRVKQNILQTERKIFTYESNLESFKSRLSSYTLEIDVDSLSKENEELSKKIDEFEDAINNKKDEISTARNNLNLKEYEIKEVQGQLDISKTGVCHACGQPIDEEHINILSSRLHTLNIENAKLSRQKLKLEKELSNLNDQSRVLNDELNANNVSIRKFKDQERDKELTLNRIKDIEENINTSKEYLNSLKKEEEKLLKEQHNINELIPLIEQKEDLDEEKSVLNEKISKAKETIISNRERKKSNKLIEEEEAERDSKLKELTDKSNELLLDINTTKQSIDIFENSFPNYIILRACGQLESYINSIIANVFEGFRVKLSQSRGGVSFFYKTEDIDDDADWLPVSMSSGAQQRILSLAYTIALGKMYGLQCLLLDEVDAACSDAATKTIYKFIASLEDFSQIIFISHKEGVGEVMKESGRDNVIYYKVDKGTYEQVLGD